MTTIKHDGDGNGNGYGNGDGMFARRADDPLQALTTLNFHVSN